MNAAGIIPARYESTRLPGKPLLRDTGKYLVQHVWEQARRAASLAAVIIATDDERILRAAREFGADARLTAPSHATGTDRVAEVAAQIECDIVVNIQGDEPEIDPAAIDAAVAALDAAPDAVIATLAHRTADARRAADPNVVKVVCDSRGRALYFSRAPVPCPRDAGIQCTTRTSTRLRPGYGGQADGHPAGVRSKDAETNTRNQKPETRNQKQDQEQENRPAWLLHVGLYAYRKDFLLEFARMPQTRLERTEKLEQLRALENGYVIQVVETDYEALGVDTPADYRAFVERCKE